MTIYTINYEGRSLEQFLADLRAVGIRLLADVREAPLSRKPGFSKNVLAAALREVDIGYRHLRPLGCPRPIRDQYRTDGDWERYTRGFMVHLQEQPAAIAELAALAGAESTALLCYEADFNRCHRSYVAREVAKIIGAQVRHITADGLVTDAIRGSQAEQLRLVS
jgi:uncharacterized protein (DUF488 family)